MYPSHWGYCESRLLPSSLLLYLLTGKEIKFHFKSLPPPPSPSVSSSRRRSFRESDNGTESRRVERKQSRQQMWASILDLFMSKHERRL